MANRNDKAGRLLALALRHNPSALDISLDAQGYANVEEVLQGLAAHGKAISRKDLERIVATNDKKRFAFSEDGTKIRASQGHSVEVDLGYEPQKPPAVLYHGTAMHNEGSIKSKGIVKGRRHHVHLSVDKATALRVGSRHGTACVFTVDAERMHADGHLFCLRERRLAGGPRTCGLPQVTHVDRWFSSLSADERKTVLYTLHCFRSLGDTMAPRTAIAHARHLWPRVDGLLRALEEDHEDLKSSEESRPTIPSPRESGAFSVFPGAPDSKKSK